jgi:hypothetical protein
MNGLLTLGMMAYLIFMPCAFGSLEPTSHTEKKISPILSRTLQVRGKQVELGARKPSLRHRLEPRMFGDTWVFDSEIDRVTLHFQDEVLQRWHRRLEIPENQDPSKNLSFAAQGLKKEMRDTEVIRLLGEPHLQEESLSFSTYSLQWVFYLDNEFLKKKWMERNILSEKSSSDPKNFSTEQDKTPMVILSFDNTFHVIDITFTDDVSQLETFLKHSCCPNHV